MQTFALQTKLCFGENALDALSDIQAQRVLIVTDRFFAENGIAEQIGKHCGCEFRIFSEVQPDPALTLIAQGVQVMQDFSPDTLIALGGGSAIDCAKGMLAMSGKNACLIAIPTSSGTGSEVTSFAILSHGGVKHPLVDDSLRPRMAILDASLLQKLPKSLIADAGMDVLSHCIEAVAAKNASPFSEAFAVCAFRNALELLPKSYRGDCSVRETVHCAATMAGVAFDSAGLGACHALSHAIGGTFHLAHGRINGILLPHIITFNAPACAPSYSGLANMCGLSGVAGLRLALTRVRKQLELPASLREAGLTREAVAQEAETISEAAVNDPCTLTNPRPVTKSDYLALLRSAL